MFRSIFTRMLMTYLTITVLVIATLTMVITFVYKQNIFDAKRHDMEAVAAQVGSLTQDFYNQTIDAGELKAAVDAMGTRTSTMIYVLKIDRAQLAQSQALQLNGLQDAFIAQELPSVLDGQTVFSNKQYSQNFNTYVLFTGYPLTINGQIQGAVLLLCPISTINADIARMNLIMWLVALAALLLSVPLIYLSSRRISHPIKAMGVAARQIAAGEQTEYGAVTTPDEIGQLAKSFQYMQDQLQKTENVRRDFIANVSHELRTPLTSIHGFVQAILDGVVAPADQGEYLEIVQAETNRLIHLTSDLLDMAKLQAGNLVLRPARLNLKKIVAGVLSSQALIAAAQNIAITSQIDPELYIFADADALTQILLNIISNALKYTPEGGSIVIQAQPQDDRVQITIQDNGPGISSQDLPYIFEKFYRTNRVRNADDKSTGLGLAITKNLIILQDGAIHAESGPGRGTAIIFTLPAAGA